MGILLVASNISRGILLPISQKALKDFINNAIENIDNKEVWIEPLIKYSGIITAIIISETINAVSCILLRMTLRHALRQDLLGWIEDNTFYGMSQTNSGKQIKSPESDIITTPYEFCLNLVNLTNDRLSTLSCSLGAIYSLWQISALLELSLCGITISIPYIVLICLTYAYLYSFFSSWANGVVKSYVTQSIEVFNNLNALSHNVHKQKKSLAFHNGGNFQKNRGIEMNNETLKIIEKSLRSQSNLSFLNSVHHNFSPIIGILAQLLSKSVNPGDLLNCGINFALVIKGVCPQRETLDQRKKLESDAEKLRVLLKTISEFEELKKNCKVNFHYSHKTWSINLNIQIKDKKKKYHIHSKLEPGKRYRILGQNGAGKSTLLEILRQNMRPDLGSGDIYLPEKNEIFFLPQTPYILSGNEYSLLNSILFPRETTPDNQTIKLIKELISKFRSLKPLVNQLEKKGEIDWNEKLSLGQKHQISIITAIVNKPKLLFADEPFEGLDAQSYTTAVKLINEYLHDTTIVYIHHKRKPSTNTKKTPTTRNQQPIKIIEEKF